MLAHNQEAHVAIGELPPCRDEDEGRSEADSHMLEDEAARLLDDRHHRCDVALVGQRLALIIVDDRGEP